MERQGGEELAAKQRADHASGQEVAAPRRAPLAVREAAVGDQRVDVWMECHRARPGMDGEQHAGGGAQVARFGEQFGERVGGGMEQGIGHPFPVEAPPVEQVVGQGEDQMMMCTGQQAGALLRQPSVFNLPRAART